MLYLKNYLLGNYLVNGKDDLKQVMIDEMDIGDSELEAYGIESSFLGDLAADFVDMISIEYKIYDVSENGDDTYTVNADIKMSTPNSEVLNGDIMESHGEEITNYMMELGLSESSYEEEQLEAMGKAIKYGFELMIEDVKNSPKETS